MSCKPILFALITLLLHTVPVDAEDTVEDTVEGPDYATEIAPIFKRYCAGCHDEEDREGGLSLESFAELKKGGDNGAVVVPKKPEKSKLTLTLEREVKPFMPPEGSEGPNEDEIALLKEWITAGAIGPEGSQPIVPKLDTPKIPVTGDVRHPVNAVAYSSNAELVAVGRYGAVEILSANSLKLQRRLTGITGHVNDVGFSQDGSLLFAAAGEPGLFGEAVLWSVPKWQPLRTIKAHTDSLYAAAITADGRILATGSYDQKIQLWDVKSGSQLRQLDGHNGAIYDLAFHPSGKQLVSASGDRTVKLWDVETGKRLDTFGQPTKEQYTVAFSPDGKQVVAGGVDNRIRVWALNQPNREDVNPLISSRFAHQAPILKLAFSPDGMTLVSSAENRTVKLWDTKSYEQIRTLKEQSDWPTALSVKPDNSTVLIGRQDGTLATGNLNAKTDQLPSPLDGYPMQTIPVADAKPITAPSSTKGALLKTGQADYFKFEAKKNQTWILETNAARSKSPADTIIQVFDANGKPVVRNLLQAVRDSWITFRPIDSSSRDVRVRYWEEMGLNEYVYLGGEVTKIFRMPEGPDSGLQLYPSSNNKRQLYFDTSATIHALDDPVYIVQPLPAAARPKDNGLPIFPVFYLNDDDADRELGNDSRLTFTAPADGTYVVRVKDVRGFGGENFTYTLNIKEPKPDFTLTVDGKNAKVAPGSGKKLTFKVNRHDNFNGPITINIAEVPAGYTVASPVVIEAGHNQAVGVIHVDSAAEAKTKEQWEQVKVTATANINGKAVSKSIGTLGVIELEKPPKLYVSLQPDPTLIKNDTGDSAPFVIEMRAGTESTAFLQINRNGHDADIRFDVNNLPHGVIVNNLGLSGITIKKGQNDRVLYLKAEDWVQPTERLIHATSRGVGNQTSPPILFRILPAEKETTE